MSTATMGAQMRGRRLIITIATIVGTLVAGAVVMPAQSAQAAGRVPVLGSARYLAPYGDGWGVAQPSRIFNGGAPSGLVRHIHWRHWGAQRAIGRGMTSLYKPRGGYYRRSGRIVLQAYRLGSCGNGRRAYTRLRFRVARRPGGPVGHHWYHWASSSGNICR